MKQVALFVVLAVLANVLTVAALPSLVNAYVLRQLVERAGGWNTAVAWPRATAESRTIVRPSPDLLYTSCAFDVSARPLRITSPVPGSYVSISGFALNTDNFFAVNDAHAVTGPDGRKRLDVVIARDRMPPGIPGAKLVVAPTSRGLILFRTLITRDADLPKLQALQAQQRCEQL